MVESTYMQERNIASATLLVVARSPLRRTLLLQQLEILGYHVILDTGDKPLSDRISGKKYDLLIVDVEETETREHYSLAAQAAELLAQGVPALILQPGAQVDTELWAQEALGQRIALALRNRTPAHVIAERAQHWEGLHVLDPQTSLFNRRYFDAILPVEIDRAKRMHQPMALVLLELGQLSLENDYLWQAVSGRLLTSLRQADIIVRFDHQSVLVLLPFTEAALARPVAVRLVKTLSLLALDDSTLLDCTAGIVAYPQHGTTPDALLTGLKRALQKATQATPVISYDQV